MSLGSSGGNGQSHLEQRSALHKAAYERDKTSFIKDGRLFLYHPELEEVGDVTGKSLLHLQCRSGLETLSWAKLGAQTVGVDFDQTAIQRAKYLAQDFNATFHRTDIYELPEILSETFDIVYTGYGVLYWLGDLPAWGKLVARYLKPGGTFYLVDYHPAANLLDEDLDPQNPEAPYPGSCYHYQHMQYQHHSKKESLPPFEYRGMRIWAYPLSDVLNALIDAGLHITYIHEQEYMFAHRFEQMEKDQQGYWRWRDPNYHVPLLFSVKATR
jgi:SAM-dependent methyltransferase